ncbi:unnamed protein product [Adineta steineri]|uniref:Ammonium transporter AmtB-like domain-containing protein n=1 Tax=Adineta steineri TaxID=433720 RepID=A0A816ESV9_9BILA|nr:unnamed protein product [Adineta steineri]CAF1653421.1 unnamed protein product [Adineta steineri]
MSCIFYFYFSGLALLALVNTYAAAGLVTWVIIDAIRGQVSVSGVCVGPVIGLVGIIPACSFVQPGWALLFGIIPTIIIYFLLLYKHHLIFNDTLDVAVVHGCCFASVCTIAIPISLKYTIGICLLPNEELKGLDWIAHGEKWSHNDKPSQALTSTGIPMNKPKYAPYTIQNNWKPTRSSPRPRSIQKQNSLVKLRLTITQSRYNASQSQSDKNIQPSYTYNSSLLVSMRTNFFWVVFK